MNTEEFPPLEPFLTNSTCYAGIGSRSTPQSTLILIREIAALLADYNLLLRSGGAPGADTAFEKGCDQKGGKKDIFLPWKGFNHHPSSFFDPPEKAEEIAALIHPNWRAVRPNHRAFHARNVQQIYGLKVDTPANFVLFWAPEENNRVQGGAATAVHLAREMKIPTFNLWNKITLQRWQELLEYHRRK